MHQLEQHQPKFVTVGFSHNQFFVAIKYFKFFASEEVLLRLLEFAFNEQSHGVVITHEVILSQTVDILYCTCFFIFCLWDYSVFLQLVPVKFHWTVYHLSFAHFNGFLFRLGVEREVNWKVNHSGHIQIYQFVSFAHANSIPESYVIMCDAMIVKLNEAFADIHHIAYFLFLF